MAYKIKNILTGTIPERITYVYGSTQRLANIWDDLEIEDDEAMMVCPTFPTDADNPKTLQTARNWAELQAGAARRRTVDTQPDAKVEEVTVDNKPMKGVKVVSLEKRREGGRAYKVLVSGNYYVDLREDVFLDASMKEGIKVGGILGGSYIWAKIGSNMKLIRVGSALHDAMLIATARRTMNKVDTKNLKVGGVYQNKSGKRFIYLGKFNSYELTSEYDKTVNAKWTSGRKSILRGKLHTNQHLVMEISKHSLNEPAQEVWDKAFREGHYFYLNFSKSPGNYVEMVEEITLPQDVSGTMRQFGQNAANNKDFMSYNRAAKGKYVDYGRYMTIHHPTEAYVIPQAMLDLDGTDY